MPSWTTSSAIEFTSNGVKVMGDLAATTKRLAADVKALQATVDAAVASLDAFSLSAIRATEAIVDLSAATGKASTATTRSTTRVTRAAAAYDAMAVSAARAAAAVESVKTAQPRLSRGGGGGLGGGAGFMAGLAGGATGLAFRAAKDAAVVGVGFGIDSLYEAGKLQQIMLSIKNETGAPNSQIDKFAQTAYTIGAQNGMSVNEAGAILQTISRLTAGQFSTDKMMQVAPMVAKYASLVHFNRPDVSVEDAAKTGIQSAHLFHAYTAAALNPLLDKTYRLSGMMAEKPDAALKQLTYYVPLFKAAHISDETSLATMALLDRAGFRNKVGTNVRALALESFGPLQMTTSAQAGKAGLLRNMGLFDKSGKFAWNAKDGGVNFFGEIGAISKWADAEQKAHVPMSTIIKDLTSALGRQGATVGALFLDKQMPGILDGLRKYLRDPNVGLNAAQKNRDSGFDYRFTAAGKDFQSLATELGGVALPGLTKGFKDLGDSFHGAQVWLHQHKDLEKQWADNVMGQVTDLEQFLSSHRADLKYLAKDASTAMHAIEGLSKAVVFLGGVALSTYGDIHRVDDWISKHVPFLAPPDQMRVPQSSTTTAQRLYHELHGKKQFIGPASSSSGGHSNLVLDIGKAIAHALGMDPADAKRGSWGGTYVEQHFDMRGNPINPHTIAAAAKAGVHAALNTGGAHHTSPTLPNPRTVSMHHGAH